MAFDPRILPSDPVVTLDAHLARGGGAGLVGARHVGAEETLAVLAASGLRGRGGAGFPAAVKWRSVAGGAPGTRYVVANGAEGEPGTFKDRTLLRTNPFAVLEGVLIAAETVGARQAFVALKASFEPETAALRGALREIEGAGWLHGIEVTLVTGPEEYLFGEEKALLEVIEGREPLPRWLPPYLHGLFATGPQLGWQATDGDIDPAAGANPTLVNNVETLAHVAWILAHGVEAFRSEGTEGTPGSVSCTVVGDVDRPGVHEVPAGTPLRQVLDTCGGPRPDRSVKAVFSGVSNAVITADLLDTPLCFDAMEQAGVGLGSAGFVVYDDSACMVEVATMLSRFLAVESCGQCPPCKLGSGQITAALDRIRTGQGEDADLGRIAENLRIVADGNRCYIPVQERVMVSSILRAFPDDVAAHLEGRCPSDRSVVPTPKIADIVDGRVTYDDRQDRKRPDWTYDT
ncbi:NADH-ubiquinone oxidoreductase-F iron-sulfur binding region domain-containing protein [Rhabdothermincola salaria]|uniref:NADH-ubiquinone oxidoreductase-F iron-sulfur binding region domain-containing protein n=1 Tax=Rhabdothermincola salaria TaxID=2903142 RepID=UPI001E5A022B|nr:NADH-ubiquinone oxidoreductase-F iron-sulfur binding region domain-containing protein [Rhabdothermincola salaria]MCD9622260.1 SLBB domain-containing protein [Rhabdothermincola salaria]